MAELPQGPPGAGRVVLTGAAAFLLAIAMARLLLQGDWAWGVAALAFPIVLVLARLLLGWPLAIALTVFFAAAVLLVRSLLLEARFSWPLLLLGGLFLVSALLAGRVVATLFAMRKADAEEADLRTGK